MENKGDKRARASGGRQFIALGFLIVLLILSIVLILSINDVIVNPPEQEPKQTEVQIDTDQIQAIIDELNVSTVETISNKQNEQSDLILSAAEVDIKALDSYAASIDPKQESAHALAILRPKVEQYSSVKQSLVGYIADKQRYFIENGLTDSDKYSIVQQAQLIESGEYIVLVIEKNSQELLNTILSELREIQGELEGSNVDGLNGLNGGGTSGTGEVNDIISSETISEPDNTGGIGEPEGSVDGNMESNVPESPDNAGQTDSEAPAEPTEPKDPDDPTANTTDEPENKSANAKIEVKTGD